MSLKTIRRFISRGFSSSLIAVQFNACRSTDDYWYGIELESELSVLAQDWRPAQYSLPRAARPNLTQAKRQEGQRDRDAHVVRIAVHPDNVTEHQQEAVSLSS